MILLSLELVLEFVLLQIVSLKIQIGQYILVLEAGKDETLYTDILAVASFLESSEYS